MNLYVSADMEGTAGICSWKQCDPSDTHEYPIYRRLMSREVRAAVDGARAAGVRAVTINDAHWSMRNLCFDELPADDDVRVISGTRKPLSMVERLDARYAAAFFTGYHAGAGEAGVLAHTYAGEAIYAVRLNGVACNEALLNAAYAGTHGVPVALISGDRAVVASAARHLPWAIGVCVKEPIGQSAIETCSPQAAREALYAAAALAIERVASMRPFGFDPPFVLEIETVGGEHADFIELMPGFARIGSRALRFEAGDYAEVLRAFIAATRLGSAASVPA